MRPRTLIILIALAAAAVAVFALRGSQSAEASPAAAPPPPPPPVTVAAVEAREVAETTEFTGRLGAVDDVEVRPRVSGHIEEIHFRSGQLVKRGDPLFTIDSRYYRAVLAAAEAQVAQAKVRLDTADREARRSNQLLETRAISAEEAEGRIAREAEARAALLSAEAARDSARLDVEYTRIVSPVDGRVSRALVTPGNFVSGVPSANTLLTTIVSVDPMYVYVDVDENSLLHLQRLMRADELPHDAESRVLVEVGLADETGFPRAGVVESLGNQLDTGTGSILMRVQVQNHDGLLLPGLFARVRMPTTARKPTVLVNPRAIGTDQSQKFVYVVGADDVAQYRAITLGPLVDGMRIARSGLEPGERIVVNGLQRTRPGSKVAPEPEKSAAEAR